MPDVDRARITRADEVVAQAELPREGHGGRPGREERVRAVLDDEAVDALRRDLAAEAWARLDEGHRDAIEGERPRGREAGDAAADDEDAHGTRHAVGQAGAAAGSTGMP